VTEAVTLDPLLDPTLGPIAVEVTGKHLMATVEAMEVILVSPEGWWTTAGRLPLIAALHAHEWHAAFPRAGAR
jgi:hypothetical protein